MQDQKERQASLLPQGLSLPLSPFISTLVALGGGIFKSLKPAIPYPIIYFAAPDGQILTALYDSEFSADTIRARLARYQESVRVLRGSDELFSLGCSGSPRDGSPVLHFETERQVKGGACVTLPIAEKSTVCEEGTSEAVNSGAASPSNSEDIMSHYLRVRLEEFVTQASLLRNVWPPEARNTAAIHHAQGMIDILREQLKFPPLLDIRVSHNIQLIRSDAA